MRYVLILFLLATPSYADDIEASPGPEMSAPTPPWPTPAVMPAPPQSGPRAQRGAPFNRDLPVIAELPSNEGELPTHSHWFRNLSALPVAQSDTVVLGRVFSAQSFVSPDGGTAYTEYMLNVERVFSSSRSIAISEHLTLQRASGLLKFPDGKHQWASQEAGLGVPQRAGRYVMFLHRNPETDTFRIMTGYRLQAGKVVEPLDSVGRFREYVQYKESAFIEKVVAALSAIGAN